MNRRDFLKRAGKTTAAVGLSSLGGAVVSGGKKNSEPLNVYSAEFEGYYGGATSDNEEIFIALHSGTNTTSHAYIHGRYDLKTKNWHSIRVRNNDEKRIRGTSGSEKTEVQFLLDRAMNDTIRAENKENN
jgi:hypothetical protein